jgi:hypothetical protein
VRGDLEITATSGHSVHQQRSPAICQHRQPIPNALFVPLLECWLSQASPPLPLLLSSTSLLVRLAHNYSTPCKLIPVFVQLSVIWITDWGAVQSIFGCFLRWERPKILFLSTTTSFYSPPLSRYEIRITYAVFPLENDTPCNAIYPSARTFI